MTVKIFALLGFLCGLAALVAQARLQSHGNDIGMLEELRVIAAAVTEAEAHGIPGDVIADIWERLVEGSIAYEFGEWDRTRG